MKLSETIKNIVKHPKEVLTIGTAIFGGFFGSAYAEKINFNDKFCLDVVNSRRYKNKDHKILTTKSKDKLVKCTYNGLHEIYNRSDRTTLNVDAQYYHKDGKHSLKAASIETLKKLNFAELMKVNVLIDALQYESTIKDIERIIRRDLRDKYSEHGGIIEYSTGKPSLIFKEIKSDNNKRDHKQNRKYYLPDRKRKTTVLSCFHLHALEKKEKDESYPKYGFPSDSDLEVADIYSIDGLVITYFKHGFNVDFYTDKGHVIDLGIYASKDGIYAKNNLFVQSFNRPIRKLEKE